MTLAVKQNATVKVSLIKLVIEKLSIVPPFFGENNDFNYIKDYFVLNSNRKHLMLKKTTTNSFISGNIKKEIQQPL